MSPASEPATAFDVIARLEVLQRKLNAEGLYVRENTCWLAIQTIRALLDERRLDEEANRNDR